VRRRTFSLSFLPLLLLTCQLFVALLLDDGRQSRLDLASAEAAERLVLDEVPEEENVQDKREQQTQHTQHPDDEREGHERQNQGLVAIVLAELLEIVEELVEAGAVGDALARLDQNGFADGVERKGVDDLARSLGEEEADGACLR
jgi:hypothetical protein